MYIFFDKAYEEVPQARFRTPSVYSGLKALRARVREGDAGIRLGLTGSLFGSCSRDYCGERRAERRERRAVIGRG